MVRIFSVAFARGYGALVSLGTLIISARYLGPEGRGIFSAAIAWAAVFCVVFNLSIGPALQYRIQVSRSAYTPAAIVGTFLAICLMASLAAWGSGLVAFFISDGTLFRGLAPDVLLLAFAAVPLLMWEQYSPNIFSSLSRMPLANRAQYIGRTSGMLMVVILVGWLNLGVKGALVAVFITQLIVSLVGLIPLLSSFKWKLQWLLDGEVKPLLSAGAKLHISSVSAFLLDQSSVLIVNNYLTKTDVGFYQLAIQLVALILILPQSALMILYGDMSKSDPASIWPQQRKTILMVMGVIFLVSLCGWLLAPYLIPLVAGEKFRPSIPMFAALLPSLLGLSMSIMITPQWLGRGLFKLSNSITFLSLAAVVIGTFWAVPRYGIDGAINVRLIVYAGLLPIAHFAFWRWCDRQSRTTNGVPVRT